MSLYRTQSATIVLFLLRTSVILFVSLNVGDLFAQGKLGRIRSATSGKSNSRPSEPKPQPERRSDSSNERKRERNRSIPSVTLSVTSSNENSQRQNQSTRNQNQSGKLSKVRSQVRREPPRTQTPSTQPPARRPGPQPRNRSRHRRDPFPRPGFGSNQCFRPAPIIAPVPHRFARPTTVVVHETVPVYHPGPPTVIVQEAPVVPAPQPVLQGPGQVAPQVSVPPPPVPAQDVRTVVETSPLDLVGVNWFELGDSRFWAAIGSDFDGLTFGTLALSLQEARGLGLDLSVSTIRESGMDFRDNLWIGDVNLMYQIIRTQRLKTKIGAGVNWMGDRFGGDAGFNLTAEAEIRLGQQWSVVGQGDFGSLGDADFMHGRISLNRRLGDAEWTIGAEQYDIGGAKIESVFTGIGVRF